MPPSILPAHARKTALAYASRVALRRPLLGRDHVLAWAQLALLGRPGRRSCWSGRPSSAPPCPWAASWSSTWSRARGGPAG
eukprot:5996773-Prymnesium_polylepis.1